MIMIYMLIAIALLIICGIKLVTYANEDYRYGAKETIINIIGFVFLILSLIASVLYIFAGFNWVASGYKAEIINREYGTNYTTQEVFFASSVIDTIRQLDRKRIDLNGDLMEIKTEDPELDQ